MSETKAFRVSFLALFASLLSLVPYFTLLTPRLLFATSLYLLLSPFSNPRHLFPTLRLFLPFLLSLFPPFSVLLRVTSNPFPLLPCSSCCLLALSCPSPSLLPLLARCLLSRLSVSLCLILIASPLSCSSASAKDTAAPKTSAGSVVASRSFFCSPRFSVRFMKEVMSTAAADRVAV